MKHIVSAKLFLIDAADNVLLFRRSGTHPRHPHAPDMPGGEVEAGELLHEAVVREVREETELTVDGTRMHLLHAATDERDYGMIVRPMFGLRIAQVKPAVTLSWEHESHEWRPVADLTEADFEPAYWRGAQMILEDKLWKYL